MQILSALDATFIYLESEHSPMAIGGIYVIDAADVPADFSYTSWSALVADRLKCSKVFRQRLVEVPWDLSFPYWVEDPDFELTSHLPKTRLRAPGGMAELMQLAAATWGKVLDRDKPLWEMVFVEGLDSIEGLSKGSYALITKVHHAAVDGKAGGEMMSSLMDMSPEIRQIPGADSWQPEELPSKWDAVTESWMKAGKKALGLPGFVGKTAMGAALLYKDKRLKKLNAPPRILSAPRTIFNRSIKSRRTYWAQNFDFERIRAIRKSVPGVTVNDVVLAVCAGGLRNYLLVKGELPEKPLVAMAPISVRNDNPGDGAGNQVSAMLVGLATDLSSPLERLLTIQQGTLNSKVQASALPANEITEYLPSETLAVATRMYTRTRLGGRHRPFFNVTITNVPGPPMPLYINGAKIHSAFGMAPILDGLGLILVVLSYKGQISIGVNSCEQMIPDPDFFMQCIAGSFAELESAIKQTKRQSSDQAQLGKPPATRKSVFSEATKALDDALETLKGQE